MIFLKVIFFPNRCYLSVYTFIDSTFFYCLEKNFSTKYILINCYSIYYIDFILENAERKPGKHGQRRSGTRRKNSPTSRRTRTTETNRKRTGATVEVYKKGFFFITT